MKKRIKSTISLLLALLMCASSLGAVASFAEDTEADNTPALSWKGYEGEHVITSKFSDDDDAYWYVETDNSKGGDSILTFDDGTISDARTDYNSVIDEIGGIGGHITFKKAGLGYNPFICIGFKLVYDDSKEVVVDATEMGGVTVTYTSDIALSLQLDMGEEGNNTLGYDLPSAALPRTTTCNTKTIPWSSFKQAGWGKAKISGAEAAAKLVGFRFYISADDGTESNINIVSITDYDGNATSVCKKFVPKDETSHACANKYCTKVAEHTAGESEKVYYREATCVDDGTYKNFTTCTECGKKFSLGDLCSEPRLGHSFTNYVSDNNATCTADGTKTAKCDRCDVTDTITDEGTATGHKDDNKDGICDICKTIMDASIANPCSNAKINVAADKAVDYRTKVTIKATAENVPEEYILVLTVNGTDYRGDNKEVTCKEFEIKGDTTYSVKVVDKEGKIRQMQTATLSQKRAARLPAM